MKQRPANRFATFLLAASVLGMMLVQTQSAEAQDPRQRRRALVEDLLRGLIDSQLEKNRFDENDPRNGVRPGSRPGINGRPPNISVSPQMLEARRHFAGWSSQAAHLVSGLRREETQLPRIRPWLADAIRIQASIDVLNRRAMALPTLDPLANDFRMLDGQWRLLCHRLKQVRGLSPECLKCIEDINRADQQLCGIFGIQPQIDRVEISRLCASLSSNFEHLLQDIYYDLRNDPRMPSLMREGQDLYTRINQATSLVPRSSYESIVEAFKAGQVGWRAFEHKLCQNPSERIRRDLNAIETIGGKIREQLWLPVEIDRAYLKMVATEMDRDVRKVFRSITMEQLLNCQRPGMVLSTAREFQRLCSQFAASLDSNPSIDDLIWDFRLFDVQWNELDDHLRQFQLPVVTRRVAEINNGMQVLSRVFGEGPVIGRGDLMQMCSDLEQLTRRLSRQIHRRVGQQSYGQEFRRDICGRGDALQQSVQNMSRFVSGSRISNTNYDIRPIVNHWNSVKPMLVQCQGDDRRELAVLRNQIEPLMVKLQVVFAD